MKKYIFILCLFLVEPVFADSENFNEKENYNFLSELKTSFPKVIYGDNYDLYVPFLTWHNRLMYDKKDYDSYNEIPWGGGVGKHYEDDKGNEYSLVFIGFADSHYHAQFVLVYGYLANYYFGNNKDFNLGIGAKAGLSSRQDMINYIPIPGVLPVFSIGYKNISFQTTYIPGTYGNGNVLFGWLRIGF